MISHRKLVFTLFLATSTMSYTAQENPERNNQLFCHDERRTNPADIIEQPTMIVLNYSQKTNLEESHASLRNAKLSTHYIIDKNGDIYESIGAEPVKIEFIDNTPIINKEHIQRRAWHTGIGYWNGDKQEINNINTHAIGILFVNESSDNKKSPDYVIGNQENTNEWDDFTPEQEQSFVNLAKQLQKIYNIADKDIVGYNEVRATANDGSGILNGGGGPGPKFPWKAVAQQGVGIYHNVPEEELAQAVTTDITELQTDLHDWGYSIQVTGEEDAPTKAAVQQVQIHHDAQYYNAEKQYDLKRTHMIMKSLLAQHCAKKAQQESTPHHASK